ncbi:Putative transcriptional regulatory protein MLAUSG7_v1_0397 [Methanocaldococcus lauensis]|uniref:Putative transcriptional regulatory protein MLAUSG7_0397 n=1 Tax=Methanocaldococcus lauensis TaxID=2546128 RepID=A0A8D6PSQ3_9EURY|nr:Tfx family DNA-binding protein [Methanocaldococcus lauensis]CAB3287800.1 Putative transcriptional regulatory protein MLAUSG7_v1_0397 [Methanocaldococcus lauensis]
MESFLTETQIKVLKLRKKGLTQEEIAKLLGTSRANISMIEKRAKENIKKAYNTIKIYNMIIAPVSIEIDEGIDVLEIPKIVFKKADEENIKVKYNTLELIDLIKEKASDFIENRITIKKFKIYILENGDVEISR